MKLYDWVLSPDCYKARLLAALTGQSLTTVATDVFPGKDHLTPAFRDMNPRATLPVLVAGDLVLTEVPAILIYLGGDWGGDNATERARQAEWLTFSQRLAGTLGLARRIDMMDAPGDLAQAQRDGTRLLRQLEARLFDRQTLGHAFLTGPAPTLADIACFPDVMLAPDGGVSLAPYAAIRAWSRAIRSLPGFIEMPGIPRLHELSPEPGA
ncbi:glutathione S-transferase N-terminal domain-containing protein [Pseudooceanicola sp. CBS1P-1]|uniref:Glutathione S-transferase family protein n=1 Tax=Pseudooceanicola albus TaxID=2692189 RepID=A0A6L7G9H5_9RHOB|nr:MULTISPECIES: glutathione S-transferase N-terminal domain-containing protein [Pseudooceanicola]MBT9384480.1 glutathione S-transferase N-terminal domain-containing protein [Pseudooceanicola endophyticus]MXN20619.1 glutathione S-transferase family protein [Pseudooceanicola albus]